MQDIPDTFYEDSIAEVISLGGDTDTNACIVGGIVGALVGVHKIKRSMLHTLLSFSCQDDLLRVDRGEQWNVAKHACPNIVKLIETRIKKEAIIVE